jgi:drug/metabolite transporter (DMT)-like permease
VTAARSTAGAVPESPATARAGAASGRRLDTPTIVALAAVWIIWGSTYLGIRIGLETFAPFPMQAIRFTVAGGAMFAWLRLRGEPMPSARQWANAAIIGLLLLIGGLGTVTLAEDHGVGSGLTATMIAISPMWLALWGRIWGGWPNRREWTGMALGLVAVVVLALGNDFGTSAIGLVLLLISPISWTFGSALTVHVNMPRGAMASACEMLAGAAGFWILALVTGQGIGSPSARSTAALAYLIVFGSIVAYTAYQYLLEHTTASIATSYAYVNPIVAVLLGTVLVDEPLTWGICVALPLVVTSVVLITSAHRGEPAEAEPESEHA